MKIRVDRAAQRDVVNIDTEKKRTSRTTAVKQFKVAVRTAWVASPIQNAHRELFCCTKKTLEKKGKIKICFSSGTVNS